MESYRPGFKSQVLPLNCSYLQPCHSLVSISACYLISLSLSFLKSTLELEILAADLVVGVHITNTMRHLCMKTHQRLETLNACVAHHDVYSSLLSPVLHFPGHSYSRVSCLPWLQNLALCYVNTRRLALKNYILCKSHTTSVFKQPYLCLPYKLQYQKIRILCSF